MYDLPGYDAWKLASPPDDELDGSLCGSCDKLDGCSKAGKDIEDCDDFVEWDEAEKEAK